MHWLLLLTAALLFHIRGKRLPALVILFFFITSGFQFMPLAVFQTNWGISKALDFALIFVASTFVLDLKKNVRLIQSDAFAKNIVLFLGFVVLAVLFSLFVYQYSLESVLRASRRYFFLLIYFNYRQLSHQELRRLFSFFRIVTIFQCVVFLIQIPLGVSLMNTGTSEGGTAQFIGQTGTWTRYYNLPVFAILYFFYSLFLKKRNRISYWLILALFTMTVIAPLHRSLIFILLVTVIMVNYSAHLKMRLSTPLLAAMMLIPIMVMPSVVVERLESGIEELQAIKEYGFETGKGNLSFRLAHAYERAEFVTKSWERIVFGLGFLVDDTQQARALSFQTVYGGKRHEVIQVSTGDIAWSMLFLHLGLVGTMLYLWLYWDATKVIWKSRNSALGLAALSILLVTFLTSVTSSGFIDTVTFVLVPLLVSLVKNEGNKKMTVGSENAMVNTNLMAGGLQT